jgi:hypothetical protein
MKIINIFSIFMFFTLIFLLIALPFILRSFYENANNVEYYSKCKNSLKGSVFFMVEFGLFNMMLGGIHILAENIYKTQLILLFCVEFGLIFYTICNFQKKKNIFTEKLQIWMMIWASSLRILLICCCIYFISSPTDLY